MTDKIDDGGPAFARPRSDNGLDGNNLHVSYAQSGMTLRDYFAAKAIGVSWMAMDKGYFESDDPTSAVAECAYQMADAMIAARKESNDE